MRTKQQEIAAFTWLKPSAIAKTLDVDVELICDHIKMGDFPDVDGEPGAIDVGGGTKVGRYRVNPLSFDLFRKARKVKPKQERKTA